MKVRSVNYNLICVSPIAIFCVWVNFKKPHALISINSNFTRNFTYSSSRRCSFITKFSNRFWRENYDRITFTIFWVISRGGIMDLWHPSSNHKHCLLEIECRSFDGGFAKAFDLSGEAWLQNWNLKELTEGHQQDWSQGLNFSLYTKNLHEYKTSMLVWWRISAWKRQLISSV